MHTHTFYLFQILIDFWAHIRSFLQSVNVPVTQTVHRPVTTNGSRRTNTLEGLERIAKITPRI